MLYYLLISAVIGILLGYNLGYRLGRKEGKEVGLREAPLNFMEESLERGYCIICNNKEDNDRTDQNITGIRQDF